MIDKKPIEELIADCKKYWPAFPVVTQTADRQNFVHWGMSLRDYFAGQALAGMFNNHDGKYSKMDTENAWPLKEARWRAASAYRIADAMLAEREK